MFQPHRIRLAALPTPLVRLARLSTQLGGEVWVKRDDLTGLEVSGNKIRKLEYILADAQANQCDTIVTEGTPQSNHCRATAAACAHLGLRCVLLLRPSADDVPQGNHLLDVLFGADCRSFPRDDFEARRDELVASVLDELRAAGHTPRWTPMGASEPLGCWGYIRALAELAEQTLAAGIAECDVVIAISSAGTYSGALLGKLLHRLDTLDVHAVPVSDDVSHHERTVEGLCRAAIDRFNLPITFDLSPARFIDGYVGDGYAIPYRAALATIARVARTEALILDPVYTGKAFTAVADAVQKRRLGHTRPVVFLHTGGVFSNFAWNGMISEAAKSPDISD